MSHRILGVIGGAGVAATNKFCELLEVKITKNGAYRDFHHPEMIVYQATNTLSRSMFLEGKGDSFIPSYIDIAKKLKSIGANELCMVCNTAHYAIDEIEKKVAIKFINVIKNTLLKVKKHKKQNIGLIASDGCLAGKVYEKYFAEILPNAKIIYPDINMQQYVTKGIVNIKNIHRFNVIEDKNRPKSIFKEACRHLQDNGAEIIILGCTDIRVDFSQEDYRECIIVDSLEILVESVYENYRGVI